MLPSSFVQILDQEQQRKDTQYMDIMRILRLSDYHYADQQFGDSSYVGTNTHISPYSIKIPVINNSIAQYSPADTPKTVKRVEIDAKINNFEELLLRGLRSV